MNEYITDIVTPSLLTGAVQQLTAGGLPFAAVPPVLGAEQNVPGFETSPYGATAAGLPNLFPIVQTDDIEYALENINLSGQGEVARYRSWNDVPKIGKRPGITVIQGEIVPVDWSYRLNEKELKQYARLRDALAAGSPGQPGDARVANVIVNDAARAAAAVHNRLTLAHAEILTAGTMTLVELGDTTAQANALRATFPVPTANKVTPGTAWSDPSADIIGDLQAAELQYASVNNGDVPDEWWISPATMRHVAANTALKNQLIFAVGTSNAVRLPSVEVMNSVLAASGVEAPLRVIKTKRPALAGGAMANLIPDNKAIGVKAGMGSTIFSPPASASMMPTNARIEAEYQAGVIAYAQMNVRPAEVITTAEALAVPVLNNPNALFILSV